MSDDPIRHEPPTPEAARVRPGLHAPAHDHGDLPPPRHDLPTILAELDHLRRLAGPGRYRLDPFFAARRSALKQWESYLESRLRREPDDDLAASYLQAVRSHMGRPA